MLIAERPNSGYVVESSERPPRTNPIVRAGGGASDALALLGRLARVALPPKAPNGASFDTGPGHFHLRGLNAQSTSTLFDFDANHDDGAMVSRPFDLREGWVRPESASISDRVAARPDQKSTISVHKRSLLPSQSTSSSTLAESFINCRVGFAGQFFQRLSAVPASPMPSQEPVSKASSAHGALGSLLAMRNLSDDWDDEGAPRPSDKAIGRAGNVLSLARSLGLTVTEVDPDVLGGVAIWIAGTRPSATAWVSLMNNDSDTLVLTANGKVSHHPWSAQTRATLVAFLGSEDERPGV